MKPTLNGPRHPDAVRLAPLREAESLSRIAKAHASAPALLQLETGRHFLSTGELDCAEVCLDRALTLDKTPTRVSAAALAMKGHLAGKRKRFGHGRRLLRAARSLAESLDGAGDLIALCWRMEAALLADEGKPEEAVDALHESADSYAACDLPGEQARSLYLAAHHEEGAFRYADALTHYRESGSATTEPLLSIACIHGEARVLSSCGRFGEALEAISNGLDQLRRGEIEDAKEWEGGFVELRGHCQAVLGQSEEAARTRRSLVQRSSGAKRAAFSALYAADLFSMGYPEKARRYEQQALLIAEALPAAPTAMLFGLSRLNLERGQINLADEQLFDASLELPEARSPAEEMQYVLHRLAVLCAKSEVNRATIEVERILEELVPAGETALLASVLAAQGDLLRLCDRYDDAEASYLRALGLARRFLAPGTEAKVLVGLAQVEAACNDTPAASRHLQRALEIYTVCSQRVAAHSVRLLGAALPDTEAEERFAGIERLLAFGYRFECVSIDVTATLLLGGHLMEMGEQGKAMPYFRDAGQEAGEVGLQHSELIANGVRGVLLADAGESAAALELIEDTLARMDELGLISSLREELTNRYRDLTGWPWT